MDQVYPILVFMNKFSPPKKGYFLSKKEKMNIAIEFFMFKLA